MENPRRRQFIKKTAGLIALSPFIIPYNFEIRQQRVNKIILRSGWSTDNIGDAASIPAMYKLLLKNIPNTEVILWPDKMNEYIEAMMKSFFTRVNMVKGDIGEDGEPTTGEVKDAFEQADMLLYYNGAQLSVDWGDNKSNAAETRSLRYCRENNMPYVVYGTGIVPDDALSEFSTIMNDADLGFLTLAAMEDVLKEKKIKIDNLEVSPDPLISFDFKNDTYARNYLSENGLSDKQFLILSMKTRGFSQEIKKKCIHTIQSMIKPWIIDKGNYVLILSDSEDEMEPTRNIINELPESIRKNIVLYEGLISPDIASSLCEKARIIVSMSHLVSFLAIRSRIPVIYIPFNFKNDIYAGEMINYGLKNYVIDLENTSWEQVYKKLMEIDDNYVAAMLDTKDVYDSTQKDITKNMNEINRFIKKLNPVPKKKKKKKK